MALYREIRPDLAHHFTPRCVVLGSMAAAAGGTEHQVRTALQRLFEAHMLMEMARIQSEINRLFDNLLDLGQKEEVGSWMPNADIIETDSDLLLKVEVPGVRPDRLELAVHGGNLIIRGQKDRPQVDGRAEAYPLQPVRPADDLVERCLHRPPEF